MKILKFKQCDKCKGIFQILIDEDYDFDLQYCPYCGEELGGRK